MKDINLKDIDLKDVLEKLRSVDVNELGQLDLETMGSWHWLGKTVFAAVIFAIVVAFSYFIVFRVDELNTQVEQLQRQEQTLKSQLESKAFKVVNLDEYKQQMASMEASFSNLLQQLPSDTEVPGLLVDISNIALQSGLTLNRIEPKALVSADFYIELPIQIEVSGGYHQLGQFVSEVASLPRIVTLHDFRITSDDNQLLTMSILAKTYQYGGEKSGK